MKKHVKIKTKLAVIVAAGVALFTMAGWPFFRFICYCGKKGSASSKKKKKKWFQLKHTVINHPRHLYNDEYEETKKWCEAQDMTDYYITARDGLKLHASYFPAENPERIILMSHGYKGSAFGSVAHMAEYLHDNNADLLFIDQRCCGESEGKYITFGAKEQYDIIDWLKLIESINKYKLPVYLYGQSMGAAAVLLASGQGLPKEVHGIIADCGFHSMKTQLRDIASGWFHLHWVELLLLRVDLFCRIFAGFRMKDTDVGAALKKNTVPVIFFHGEDDTYVFPRNSVMNFETCRAPKELVLVPKARHLCCSFTDPEMYESKLRDFFDRLDQGI